MALTSQLIAAVGQHEARHAQADQRLNTLLGQYRQVQRTAQNRARN